MINLHTVWSQWEHFNWTFFYLPMLRVDLRFMGKISNLGIHLQSFLMSEAAYFQDMCLCSVDKYPVSAGWGHCVQTALEGLQAWRRDLRRTLDQLRCFLRKAEQRACTGAAEKGKLRLSLSLRLENSGGNERWWTQSGAEKKYHNEPGVKDQGGADLGLMPQSPVMNICWVHYLSHGENMVTYIE